MPTHFVDRQVLNRLDWEVAAWHQVLRADGRAGFLQQMHVWVKGRLDPAKLRLALSRLNRRYPAVTARLDEDRVGPYWQFRPGAEPTLHDSNLVVEGEVEALNRAEQLLATPMDLGSDDPIQFHLLHLADGRDLFLVHNTRALTDLHGLGLLVPEIDRLAAAATEPDPAPGVQDDIRAYLRGFSLWQRIKAGWKFWKMVTRLRRSAPVMLADAKGLMPRSGSGRIVVRELDETRTAALEAGVTRLCGLPSLSLALLAGIFRSVKHHTPQAMGQESSLLTAIGTNLRPDGATGPIFRNVGSSFPIGVKPGEVDNREELIRHLDRQLRESQQQHIEMGALHLARLYRPNVAWPELIRETLYRRTLGYDYLGSLAAKDTTFCGQPIERQYSLVGTFSPSGLAVTANLCSGRLVVAATYVPDTIPMPRLAKFLDTLFEELEVSSRS